MSTVPTAFSYTERLHKFKIPCSITANRIMKFISPGVLTGTCYAHSSDRWSIRLMLVSDTSVS